MSFMNVKLILASFLLLVCLGLVGIQSHASFQKQVWSGRVEDQAQIFSEQAHQAGSFNQITNLLEEIARQDGAETAFSVLKQADLPPNVDIHLLGHVVGDVLFEQEGAEGIKLCTPDFRNACSHTIVIGVFLEQGQAGLDLISDICQQAPGGVGAYTMCFHGLGHGVLAYTGYDMTKAVELCQQLGTPEKNFREAGECIGGATMEMVSGVHDPKLWELQKSQYFSDDDPFALCNLEGIEDQNRPMCVVYLTPYLLELVGANLGYPSSTDFAQAFQLCQQAPNQLQRDICYGSFGKEFVVLARDRDVRDFSTMTTAEMEQVFEWCRLAGSDSGYEQCVLSGMTSVYWGAENPVSLPVTYCSLVPEPEVQASCFQSLTGAVQYYVSDSASYQEYCELVPEALRTECWQTLELEPPEQQ